MIGAAVADAAALGTRAVLVGAAVVEAAVVDEAAVAANCWLSPGRWLSSASSMSFPFQGPQSESSDDASSSCSGRFGGIGFGEAAVAEATVASFFFFFAPIRKPFFIVSTKGIELLSRSLVNGDIHKPQNGT